MQTKGYYRCPRPHCRGRVFVETVLKRGASDAWEATCTQCGREFPAVTKAMGLSQEPTAYLEPEKRTRPKRSVI